MNRCCLAIIDIAGASSSRRLSQRLAGLCRPRAGVLAQQGLTQQDGFVSQYPGTELGSNASSDGERSGTAGPELYCFFGIEPTCWDFLDGFFAAHPPTAGEKVERELEVQVRRCLLVAGACLK